MTDRQMPSTVRVSRGIDDAVVVEPSGEEQGERLGLDLGLDHLPHGCVGLLVEGLAPRRRGLPADDGEHAGQLGRAHHRRARVGPGEEETWLVGTAAHPVVARAVGRPDVDREVGDRRVGDGVDHHRPVLDDAPLLVLLADHVARRVLEEQQWDVDLVGQLDELGRLVGFLGEEHAAVVGQHPDRIAVDRRPPGHQAGAVERLELVEPGAVDDPGEHLAGIEGHLRVGGGDPEQLLGIVDGLVGRHRGARAPLAPVEPAHDLASDPNGVELVGGELVGEAGDPGVHRGAAELLVGRFLAGRHLDQGRAPEEDLRALLDHHDVVAHARHVCAPRGRVAEDERDGGQARPPTAG